MEEANKRIAQLEEELRHERDNDTSTELARLRKQYSELSLEKTQAVEKVKTLRNENEELQASLAEKELENNKLLGLNGKYLMDIDTANSRIRVVEDSNMLKTEEIRALKGEIDKLKDLLDKNAGSDEKTR